MKNSVMFFTDALVLGVAVTGALLGGIVIALAAVYLILKG